MKKQTLTKFLIPAFYAVAIILIVFYAWNNQNIVRKGGSSPLYRNLIQYPAYVRRGFDPAELRTVPDMTNYQSGGKWALFETRPLWIMNAPLPDIPKRKYLSPRGNKDEEYTIIIPVEMDSEAVSFLDSDKTTLPGIFLALIGDNWEIFFNGTLLRSEMHIDETGRITSHRAWRDTHFPVDRSLIIQGTNILALRIVGDPTYYGTGVSFNTPHYMDDFAVIEKRQFNFLLVAVCGIFGFSGVYYLMLFFSIRKKSEIYYLYFSIFSILLCVYTAMNHGLIYYLIPNSDITHRLEYGSLMLMLPAFCMFIQTMGRGRVSKISWGYLGFCLFLAVTQIFFCNQYAEETLELWNVSIFLYYSYVFFYDVIYFYFWDRKGPRKSGATSGTVWESSAFIVNIITATLLIYICGVYELVDALFLFTSYKLFQYSSFAVQIGMAITLSQRFSGMYKQLEQSNIILETTVKERTLELEEQTAIAVQASRAKSEFLATMSHEIRTPLNAVIGLSEIELQDRLSDSSRENISQIKQSGTSLLGIINDILDISKIEAGSFELVPVEYETAQFINDTVNLNKVRLGSKPINIALEIKGDFPAKLIGDVLRVKQVLNNLLSNAIKYTDEGTVTLNIAWSAHSAGKVRLIFNVRDTGIGIRAEDMEKLFTSYTQLDTRANRKIEGTGLGLAITKNLVEMMGGSINVKSEYGKGSVFTAEILQGIENTAIIGEETAEALRNFRYVSEKKDKIITPLLLPHVQVLVVDDLPANLLVARGLLAPYGLQVDTAVSGREAVEKAGKQYYDLIFMDHMMPEMDGVETTTAIRKMDGYDHTPIVALTANALRGMRELYLEKGFQDYLSKPISPEALDEIINKLFNKHGITNTNPPLSTPYSFEIEARRLDKLNHYRAAFEMSKTSAGLKIDSEYYKRFASLIESFDALPDNLKADRALLTEAARNEDAQKIREALPSFCEEISAFYRSKVNSDETKNENTGLILQRLKKALENGDTNAAGKTVKELGAKNLNSEERELYFKLYDLLMDDNAEKALEEIERFGVG